MFNWVLLIAGYGFLLLGLFLLGLAARNFWKGRASSQWPSVEGTVIRSFVLVSSTGDGGEGYMPQVEYEYSFQGSPARGKRIRYGQIGSWSRARAERALSPWPAGSHVPVFVNPRRAADAVLRTGVSWGNLVIGVCGAVLLITGIGLLIAKVHNLQ